MTERDLKKHITALKKHMKSIVIQRTTIFSVDDYEYIFFWGHDGIRGFVTRLDPDLDMGADIVFSGEFSSFEELLSSLLSILRDEVDLIPDAYDTLIESYDKLI